MTTPYKDQKCGNCKFAVNIVDHDDKPTKEFQCRRMPPPMVDHNGFGTWPRVNDVDWCGAYRPSPLDPKAETG